MRIALAASIAYVSDASSPVARIMSRFQSYFLDVLGAELVLGTRTAGGLDRLGLLPAGKRVHHLPWEGGQALVAMAAGVASEDPAQTIDAVIHLTDPRDIDALQPEALALKRQCVVHGKPYFGTFRTAWEWCALDWSHRTKASRLPGEFDDLRPPTDGSTAGSTIALVAHDRRKVEMVKFALEHFDLLCTFPRRIATGTTCSLLNGRLPERLPPEDLALLAAPVADLKQRLDGSGLVDWVVPFQSGPKGGDAQIALEIQTGACHRVIFFEDPHVAREHEADIQLMERAARMPGVECLCLHDPVTADEWARLLTKFL